MTSSWAIAERVAAFRRAALVVGLLAAAACAAGFYYQPAEFYPAYLVAFLFWWGVSMGCLGIAMIHHLTGGIWGMAIRRILEAGYSLLPLVGVMFLPVVYGLPALYIWARPTEVEADPLLQHKLWYLNISGFQARAAGYFVVWIALALLLNRLSAGEPADEPRRRRRLALVSGPGLILWGLTVTFAAMDWSMSLEPHWFSSMYGVLIAAGQGVSGMSLAIVALALLRDLPPWSAIATPACFHDLGNLLLAFVMFWTYIAFAQYLIIWSGNLPEEAPWYLHRSRGGWQWIAVALAGLHFAVPFFLLLARETKRRPQRLAAVALLLLVMRLVDCHWLVLPSFHPHRLSVHWLHFAAPVALGGFWLAAFSWRLAVRGGLPVYELPVHEGVR